MANLPWIADCAAKRGDNRQAEENACTTKQTLDGLAAAESGGLPRIVQESGKSTAVNFFGRTIVATLHGDFFRQDLLHVLNDGKAESENGQCSGNTKQRGVESVPDEAVLP